MMETDRLILRNMTENDYDALYQILADSDIMQHQVKQQFPLDVNRWISLWIMKMRSPKYMRFQEKNGIC